MYYSTVATINIYESAALDQLVTQAVPGRYLSLSPFSFHAIASMEEQLTQPFQPIQVRLSEDGCAGWLAPEDLMYLTDAPDLYEPVRLSEVEIRDRIPQVLSFSRFLLTQPSRYLKGGSISPNYDSAGLVQAAFASANIWLPRTLPQQENFVHPISSTELMPGDLIFLSRSSVGLYLGEQSYIHSCDQELGFNSIRTDSLLDAPLRRVGRVVSTYQPDCDPGIDCLILKQLT